MEAYLPYAAAAFLLGVVTSISPCPMATNIAAISYIGRRVKSSRQILGAGTLYTAGRCLLYVALAALLAGTAMSISAVSLFLQKYMNMLLGPIFLLLGMFLLEMIVVISGAAMVSDKMQKRLEALGIWGSLPLGILFAASFCPVSAGWFFSLVTLLLGAEAEMVTGLLKKVGLTLHQTPLPPGGTVVLPLIYGIGTALPVLLVAFLLAYSAKSIGKAYNVMSKVEWWTRMVTGWLFVGLGGYFSWMYIFNAM
jgi:cytochrome c-type biogenesis protein